jgi:hypothetical protein
MLARNLASPMGIARGAVKMEKPLQYRKYPKYF